VSDSWIIACGAATAAISVIGAILQAALEAKEEEEKARTTKHVIMGSTIYTKSSTSVGGLGGVSGSGSVSMQSTERLGYPSDE